MYRGLICDLDGTVYLSGRTPQRPAELKKPGQPPLDDSSAMAKLVLGGTRHKPIPGAVEALTRLRAAGVRVLFVSNNPLRDAASYAERLSGMGIPATSDDVLTSGAVTAEWVRVNVPGARLLVLGEADLSDELTAVGAKLVDRADQTDVVVASFDRTFTYEKWVEAFRAIRAGARFVATNPDPTCPVDGGEVPDCGGIIAALEVSTGRAVETVLGKPSAAMLDAALRRLDVPAGQTLVVGDRLGTDIAMGNANGVATALVLTGVTTREMLDDRNLDISEYRPSYVLDSMADLPAIVFSELAV